jgi:L-alanine-DL-glutamate epimerase-like enolase superfamily enzyme
MIKDDILDAPYVPRNGLIEIQRKPGFGINLDEDKMMKYTTKAN